MAMRKVAEREQTAAGAPSLSEAARRLKRRPEAAGLPRLILMTDPERLPDPLAAAAWLPRGSAVIVRDPDGARRRATARRLAPLCRARRLRLLVAADRRLAAELGVGLHLPEAAAREAPRRRRPARARPLLVTAAAHGPQAIRRAAQIGADAVLLAPVFPTASHPGQPCLGAMRFARWARASLLPVYALGGVDGRTARRLQGAPLAGFAAIGALAS